MKACKIIGIVCVLAIVGAEALAQAAFRFPLYDYDNELGYWLRPNQNGAFLFTNDWAFNSDSLGVSREFATSENIDVLLVGDSLVYGGNELRQRDKLGPLLEEKSGYTVWPAAAGSWGLQNELAFLRRKPKLTANSDALVFVVNSGDFEKPSSWESELTHPSTRHFPIIPYLVRRYLLTNPALRPSPAPVAQRDVLADWKGLVQSVGVRPVVVIAYEAQDQTAGGCSWVPPQFQDYGTWFCYDGKSLGGAELFRDAIHPNAAGDQYLASAVSKVLNEVLEFREHNTN